MNPWKFGDVLQHPDSDFATQVMFIAEYTAFVLYDEDTTMPSGVAEAWPVGVREMAGLDYWKKVNDGP